MTDPEHASLGAEPPPQRTKKKARRRSPDAARRSVGNAGGLRLDGLGLVVLSVALYGRTAWFGFTHTDDVVLLRDDASFLEDLSNVLAVWGRPFFPLGSGDVYYRPLVTVSLILDAQWGGATNPTAFHVTNVVFHAVAAVLYLLFLRGLGIARGVALAAASLFVVHPTAAATVAWIPGRCDALLALWCFASFLLLQRYLKAPSRRGYIGHLACFGLALLTKESALVLPLLYVGLIVLVDEHRRAAGRDKALWGGWAAAVVLWLLLRSGVSSGGVSETMGERVRTFVTHLPVLFMQFGKLIVPFQLSVLAIVQDTPWVPGAVGALLAVTAAAWLKDRQRHLFLWGMACMVLFLLPTLLVSDYLILENRLYLPAAGVFVSFSAVALRAARYGTAPAQRWVAAAFAVLFFFLAFRHAGHFRDAPAFTIAAVEQSPHAPLAHLNHGIVLHESGHLNEAEREYEMTLRLNESQPVVHNNLGLLYMNRGELARAEQALRREIALNPRYDKAHYNLALVLGRQGRRDDTLASLRRAAELNPHYESDLREAMGAGAPSGPSMDAMLQRYAQALHRDPANRGMRRAYAELCEKRKLSCARIQYEMLLREEPENEELKRRLQGL